MARDSLRGNSIWPKVEEFEAQAKDQGERLDLFVASRCPDLSRARVQNLIRQALVRVNDTTVKPSYRLRPGDRVWVSIPPPVHYEITPEPISLEILFEDEHILVLNKPPDLVVHPAPGHPSGTLVHGLLHHCRCLKGIGGVERPGIVHRLDKDTSGLMVVAKDDFSHRALVKQFKGGGVNKRYLAMVHGPMEALEGRIELPIGRHPKNRKKMAVVKGGGKYALTLWRKRDTINRDFDLLEVDIRTGRTHQIRVHLAHSGHPVVGDPVYGYGKNWWKRTKYYRVMKIPPPQRQMLHACRLSFAHPVSGEPLRFEATAAPDMRELIEALYNTKEESA